MAPARVGWTARHRTHRSTRTRASHQVGGPIVLQRAGRPPARRRRRGQPAAPRPPPRPLAINRLFEVSAAGSPRFPSDTPRRHMLRCCSQSQGDSFGYIKGSTTLTSGLHVPGTRAMPGRTLLPARCWSRQRENSATGSCRSQTRKTSRSRPSSATTAATSAAATANVHDRRSSSSHSTTNGGS